MLLKEMPVSELPDVRCLKYGADVLTDAELLGSILRTGTKECDAIMLAQKILNSNDTYEGLLALNHLSDKDIGKIKGIGRTRIVQLMCIAELNKRMTKAKRKDAVRMTSPETIASYYMEDMRSLENEQILLLLLDSKSRVIKEITVSTGTVNASILSPREIFVNATQFGAVNIILLHNHPSGDPTPSSEDIKTTNRIKEGGDLIGIKLLDHIIIGDNRYKSFKEMGFL